MVVVDAHSKWLDGAVVTTPSSQQAINIKKPFCHAWFTRNGGFRQWFRIH